MSLVTPKGFSATGIHVGLKRKRKDLALLLCETEASAAAVYTTNHFQAAPIQVTKEAMADSNGKLRAVLINSGNANACTGDVGLAHARRSQEAVSMKWDIRPEQVAIASTGVIGQPLPIDTLLNGIGMLAPQGTDDEAESFAEAILTTDTGTKTAGSQYYQKQHLISVAGVAKGSGMIHPNMATMLGFMTTDATIEPGLLQSMLRECVDATFNSITVDGDSSTNDMVLVLASGASGAPEIEAGSEEAKQLKEAMLDVCEVLAKEIARDGEGATKLIEVHVNGAIDDMLARKIAKQIVGSSLVKTAVFGRDANWGRIVAAIGAVDEPIDVSSIMVKIGSQVVLRDSQPVLFDEEKATAELALDTVRIEVDLGAGSGAGQAYGCDLTYDYVKINASYRT
ncbi:bifunctional glutamate N-acetyltransferase/amino-acid acetyltransferase ArgJ [Exiguobacterium flavidum]|uniref:bifunctional glutamate N-acetyltransferase/amino-acid acetyltransferase ArgJ n=1 Tax=Exiguobacterium flavidum TaxID=2184695 RepID=UPI000DF7982C|nr:bifunctional glutamate N-acetyltransferase/amino-acid acetyltransferase ArgJ [Exiguobacterium flavidum]